MMPRYPNVLVLGAGTMGAQLACLLAGAGSRVRLLDVDASTAAAGLERVAKLRPSPVYAPDDLARIRTGGLDELGSAVPGVDWVLEAIVERKEPKRDLLARVDAALPPAGERPIITSNTSGLSITELAGGRSEPFRRRFFGTHFFNPPRYARLLELVPHAESDPALMADLAAFASVLLGKGTVVARDTPAFIANRLGVHGMLTALRLAQELGLGPDVVDDLTGELIGRPRSATFRTLDLVGIDVALAVAEHCAGSVDGPDRDDFVPPQILRDLVARGAIGTKAGAGFFRREPDGEILVLDLDSGEYRPRSRVRSGAIEAARAENDIARRLGMLLRGGDAPAELLRRSLTAELRYAATVAPLLADDAWSVDRAMRWGFGWQLGPLETIDALGAAGRDLLDGDATKVPSYHDGSLTWSFRDAGLRPVPARPNTLELAPLRAAATAAGLPANAAASTFDLPGGVLGLELHGKLNIIGLDSLDMLHRATELAARRYDGLVVGTAAADFSAGANLVLLLVLAEDGEFDEIDRAVRRMQAVAQEMRYSPVPVVVAPRGRTLGGGAELVLAAARAQPLAETYIGLVETGVGLIPAGGGSTAMARRAAASVPEGSGGDLFPAFTHVFTEMAMAKVATSAAEARAMWLLDGCDQVTTDPDRQWSDAARMASTLTAAGYRPPAPLLLPVLGRRGIAAAEALSFNQLAAGQISEHDRKVILELARVMSGGDIAEGSRVGEQHLLDLEREAFLRLLGERLTRDRIRHTLKTGKPLRN